MGNRLRHSLVSRVLNKHRKKKKKDSADGRALKSAAICQRVD